MYSTLGGISDQAMAGLYAYWRGKGENGFGSSTTAQQVCADWDGKGKTAIVTGPSSGIGVETAKSLAGRGCHVILAGRNIQKCQTAADTIKKAVPDAQLTVMKLDLSDLNSVKQFSNEFISAKLPLNILVCNAGVMACPYSTSAQGHEMQFATNHLGHFLLVQKLKEEMKKTAEQQKVEGRIVTVSSSAHHLCYKEGIRTDRIDDEKDYTSWGSYGQSKLANILFVRELHEKFSGEGYPIKAVSLHPGAIQTELQRHVSYVTPILKLLRFSIKSIPQGAATSVLAATNPDVKGGEYYQDCNIAPSSTLSHQKLLGQKLWEFSEQMCKEFM
eukprot:TRINITY_DN729_c0_g1_i2.p1 TRINITY_DN729_c0_g1~~TRINITY_DN729_c0_g1_i2.p1  ORF type:complete len:330 (+),score=44.54 TRINITY_DN729_c0_g1_i2:262-1251(+)